MSRVQAWSSRFFRRLFGPRPSHAVGALAVLGLLAIMLLWPLIDVVAAGFTTQGGGFTFEYLALVFSDPMLVRGLGKSLFIAVLTTLLALALALPLSVISARYDFPGKALLFALLLLPMVLPPFVGAIGVRIVLGRFGPLTELFGAARPLGIDWLGRLRISGVIIVEALALYPIILLNLQASLANVDPALERAALNLGASRWDVFRRVTFPLVRPGLFAGCTLVLIWSFTELGTPLMFHVYDVTPVQIFSQLTELDNPLPYALVVVMLVCSSALYAVGKLVFGKNPGVMSSKASSASAPKRLVGRRAIYAALPGVLVSCLAALPNVSVVLTSLSATGAWYRSILPRELTAAHYVSALHEDLVMPSFEHGAFQLGAIGNSIAYAGFATLLCTALAVGVALVVVRSHVPFRSTIDVVSMLPLAVPGLVMAFGYLSMSAQFRRTLGEDTPAWLDVQRFPVVLLVLAYAARRLPYVVRSSSAGLEQVPRDYERAAANLGAGGWRIFRRIVLPLTAASILAGALMAFVFAMLEVSDSLILAQSAEFFPITRAIWELSQRLGDGMYVASALGVWAMVLLTTTLALASGLLGKKLGAMFRV